MHTVETLKAFERDIADVFNMGNIKAPVHLSGGNEEALLSIFKSIRSSDWIFCSWRSHYHALLHGIPPEKVKAEIMAGRSIALCFPEHRFYSSAIVGGNLPIALGVAWSIKRAAGRERVFAFIGDMTGATGMCGECSRYAAGFGLPITFVVEDNGKSVCTDTLASWGTPEDRARLDGPMHVRYRYDLPWPHSGAGKRVEF